MHFQVPSDNIRKRRAEVPLRGEIHRRSAEGILSEMDKRIRGDSGASYSYKDMVDMFQQKLLPTHLRQVKVTMEINELHQLPHQTVEELITHLSSLEKQRVTPPSDEVRREHLLGAVHAYLGDTQLLKNNLTASRLMTAGARVLSIWQKKLAPHRWAGRRRSQCNTAVYKGSASHGILRVSVDQTRLHRRRTPVPGSGPADGNLGKSKRPQILARIRNNTVRKVTWGKSMGRLSKPSMRYHSVEADSPE